jgi:putative FmdB family regulatory protein
MPIYQYMCPKCNLKFELKGSFSDESIVACPKCQKGAQRLFASVPIIFKGSGFYATDNRKGGSDDAGSDDAGKADKKKDKSEHESAEK